MASWFPPPSLVWVILVFLQTCSASRFTSKATQLGERSEHFFRKIEKREKLTIKIH
jgi:hypothetical protein